MTSKSDSVQVLLAPLEEMLEKATPGKWEYAPIKPWDDLFALTFAYPNDIGHWLKQNDAQLIAICPQALRVLIECVKAQDAELNTYQTQFRDPAALEARQKTLEMLGELK